MGSGEKKVLMVTWSFPPHSASSVQRPLKFTKFLHLYGWKPYVITSDNNAGSLEYSLMKDIPEDVSVDRTFSIEPANLKAILSENYKNGKIGELRHTCLKGLLKLYSVIYYRLVIIDWHEGWIPFALKCGKDCIKKENIDVIYVDMEPPSVSMIGLLLKKVTGKRLVIDYQDPWTTAVPMQSVKGPKKEIAEYLEHKVLLAADKVIAGKEVVITELIKKFPDVDKEKYRVIYSGYDPDDFSGVKKEKNDKFTITYTGRISEKYYYSPESFLFAVGELIKEGNISRDDISIRFSGGISSRYLPRYERVIRELELEDIVVSTGNLDYKKCIEEQINSDLLLFILESLGDREMTEKFSGAVPSKIFEYIHTGVPILAIVPPGFESDLITETGTGVVAEANSISSVKECLGEIYKKYKEGTLSITPNREEIDKYDRKVLTSQLAEVFDEALNGSRG